MQLRQIGHDAEGNPNVVILEDGRKANFSHTENDEVVLEVIGSGEQVRLNVMTEIELKNGDYAVVTKKAKKAKK